jgi:hypothetical protein
MAKWKKGQSVYNQLVTNLATFVSDKLDFLTAHQTKEDQVVTYARARVPEFVDGLTVTDLLSIHEYLVYMTDMKPDPRFPTYMYSGGDRIASVTRYLQKNIDLELARQYA